MILHDFTNKEVHDKRCTTIMNKMWKMVGNTDPIPDSIKDRVLTHYYKHSSCIIYKYTNDQFLFLVFST